MSKTKSFTRKDVAMLAKLSISDSRAHKFMSHWLADDGDAGNAFSGIPEGDRFVALLRAAELNRIRFDRMDEHKWVTLCASLGLMISEGEFTFEVLCAHFGVEYRVDVGIVVLGWREASGRTVRYVYARTTATSIDNTSRLGRRINKAGRRRELYLPE